MRIFGWVAVIKLAHDTAAAKQGSMARRHDCGTGCPPAAPGEDAAGQWFQLLPMILLQASAASGLAIAAIVSDSAIVESI